MVIHVVRPGESLSSVAREYGVPLSQLAVDNGLQNDPRLVVGQALVVQFPSRCTPCSPVKASLPSPGSTA
ncbi:MAG: LysM peptidoglycan-binding domain-containing protein [Oscillospiraceae bacterium]